MANLRSSKNSLLLEIGLSEPIIEIYQTLLVQGRATLKEIQLGICSKFNYSYSQLYGCIQKLVKFKMIEKIQGSDSYIPINPHFVFEPLREEKVDLYNSIIQEFSDLYARSSFQSGICSMEANIFHFSSLELGFKILNEKFLPQIQFRMILLATPPIVLKRLKNGLLHASSHGIKIEIHYSERDFEENPNYFEQIKEFVKDIHCTIYRRLYRTYDIISYNDEYTREAHIILDDNRFITIPYHRINESTGKIGFDIDNIGGLYNVPGIIQGIIDSFHENPILEQIEYTPAQESLVLEYIRNHSPIQKSQIGKSLGIAGTQLKALLSQLEHNNKIRIEKKVQKQGRPTEEIRIM